MEQKPVGKIVKFAFPKKESAPEKNQRIKNVDGVKYYNEKQIKLLRRSVRDRAARDQAGGQITALREWMVIDLITSTGIRVSEAANVRCGDLRAGYGESALFVRDGKGFKSRTVQIPDSLKKHLKQFVVWKSSRGEATGHDDHLFLGQRGPWTSQAVQQIVKKYLKAFGLYESEKSVHALGTPTLSSYTGKRKIYGRFRNNSVMLRSRPLKFTLMLPPRISRIKYEDCGISNQ